MEYAKLGKLQSVLRNSRGVNYYTNTHGPSSLTSHELIMFCYQIAKGMDFLSSKGVRHIEPITDRRRQRCFFNNCSRIHHKSRSSLLLMKKIKLIFLSVVVFVVPRANDVQSGVKRVATGHKYTRGWQIFGNQNGSKKMFIILINNTFVLIYLHFTFDTLKQYNLVLERHGHANILHTNLLYLPISTCMFNVIFINTIHISEQNCSCKTRDLFRYLIIFKGRKMYFFPE